jgi:WD40 repeat protein
MKRIIFSITILFATAYVIAEENNEVVWETEQISDLDQLVLSPDGDKFYNTNDSIIQVRLVDDGTLIEEINIEDFSLDIEAMSISKDGNLLALSGNDPYVYLYDLNEKRLISKTTAKVLEREEYGENVVYEAEKWLTSNISPDGTRITGILYTDRGEGISNFVVIDISSNEVLFEEPRLLYDIFNPSGYNPQWLSSRYSSDGSKIVAQLEYTTPDPSSPDSIYILNANTFKKDTVLANTYFPEFLKGFVSYYNPMLAYQSKDSINLYNMSTRKIINTNLNTNI